MSKILPILLIAVAIAATPPRVMADAGHDHDAAPPQAIGSGPQRLPDGSVFLPKATQRQLALRTVIPVGGPAHKTYELAGKVVMDPNAGGKVQPTIGGRIEPGPRGLPVLGQSVSKGQVLAYVRPSAGAIERGNQAAQAAEIRANKTVAEKRVARLQQLEGTVPQKDIEAAKGEVLALTERLAAISASLVSTESLTAPLSGVVASTNVVAGQVVDAREVLFEIVDPNRLLVEAVAHDAQFATQITSATAILAPGQSLTLTLIGAGRSLRDQALPILFRVASGKKPLPAMNIGQPLTVLAQTAQVIAGYPVSATAIVKDRNNQDIVWVHTGAERFVPRVVRFVPLDGATSAVIDGLAQGDRVVVEGASLLNQVR